MTKKNKNNQYKDYDRNFREVFYIGILDDNDVVKDTRKYEKAKELREYLKVLLEGDQECIEKANNVIKSQEIKNTSKLFLLKCENLRFLIAMRLDVMTKPFENMKKIDINKLEQII
jgi:DNA polymerase elongation subunit (family B)